ncbi:MAG: heterodisulfide reductase-related iron-sulfur binding cluster [Thermomicrobiales bacterium]
MTSTTLSSTKRGFSGPDQPPEEVIHSCVHCGFCLPVCPTYRETYRERSSPRGRIWLIKAVAEGELDISDELFQEEMSLCLNCRACEAVCPSGVKYGELVESARAQIVQNEPQPLASKAARTVGLKMLLGSPRMTRAASHGARLYARSGMDKIAQSTGVMSRIGLDHAEAIRPDMSDDFLVPGQEHWPAIGPRRGTVALLAGCVMSTAFAEVHRATARVLARNGFDVVVPPDQGCCGALSVHAGEAEQGRKLARKNIDGLSGPEFDAIVVNAAGCGAAMKEYDFLLRDDPSYASKAKNFVGQVKDASEFLAEVGLTAAPGPLPIRATYQDACHLAHAQRIKQQPRDLLRAIPELELVEMPESDLCCGSAGIYNLLQREMAGRLRERKVDNALVTDAGTIISANPGCMLQLRAGLEARGSDVRVEHLMTVLDRAYESAG